MTKKNTGKGGSPPVPPTPPTPARPAPRGVEVQPNPFEIFWEKHHKVVYACLLILVALWGGQRLYSNYSAKKESAKWSEIFKDSGLLEEVPPFSDPFQRLDKADPGRLARLRNRFAGEPIAPWLEFLSLRKAFGSEEPELLANRLREFQASQPRAEVCSSPVAYAHHKEPIPPVQALLAELQENAKARVEYPSLFGNPEPDPNFSALVETDRGNIRIRFYPQAAPRQVANFCQLAREGYYDGLKVHKVSRGGDSWTPLFFEFGDPRTREPESKVEDWGQGGSEKSVPFQKSPLFHFKGTVSAVREFGDKRTAQGHVRILGEDHHRFDGLLIPFGQVVEGLDVVQSIGRDTQIQSAQPDPRDGVPLTPITIVKVTLEGDLGLVVPVPESQPATQPATQPASPSEPEK